MSRIQAQATKLWQIIKAPETFSAYKSAVSVTWDILRELFQLLWLSLMWVAVLADGSISLGRSTRTWLDTQKNNSGDRSAAEMGKALLSAGSKSLASTVSQAKSQLGIADAAESKSEPAAPVVKSESASPAAKPEPAASGSSVDQSKEPAEIS